MRLVVASLVCALGAAAAASAADAPATRDVAMPGKLYDPAHITVLTGTTVTWRNGDSTNHTVTADGDAFDSGYVGPGGSFSFTFAKQGRYTYHCVIHKFMKGEVDVFSLVLSGPEHPVALGAPVVLAGLAGAGTTSVALVRAGTTAPVQTVSPRADGSFTIRFRATAPAAFHATAAGGASPVVHVRVVPRVTARRAGGTLRVTAAPGRPGARVALQAYVPELFTWHTVARARLDRGSHALLVIPPTRPVRLRAVVRGSGGWADGTTGQIVLAR
jgi:plastocyanin